MIADENGGATVTLKAPSKPAAFHIVAKVGDNASADLAIAVSELGFAKVRVQPKYGGIRSVDEWSASVSVGVDCAAALKAYPGDLDGSLKAKSSKDGEPVVASVPVGPDLAIVARSGAVIWGCVEGKLTQPNVEFEMPLEVTDVPLALGTAKLDLELAFTPSTGEFKSLVQQGGAHLAAAAFPSASEASTILDTMRDLLASDAVADFDEHRVTTQLDATIETLLVGHSARDAIAGWTELALGATSAGMKDLAITGQLVGSAENPLAPTFSIDALGPVPGALAGTAPSVELSWKSEPSDTIVAGGTIYFSPTRFAGALVAAESVLSDPTATTGAEALANVVDCAAIGQAASFSAAASCDEACATTLCKAAIDALWAHGLAADDGLGALDVAISGTAKVDAAAVPIALAGSWVGSMSTPGAVCALGGDASATAPPPP
ncbi:MAG: hypothetical protein U0414_39350 [Polyangiaceae bacterium]